MQPCNCFVCARYKKQTRSEWLQSADTIYGEHAERTFGGDAGACTAAVLCGHGLPVLSEEDSFVDMIGKYFCQLTSPRRSASSVRRGSVESCDETDETDYSSPFGNWDTGLEREGRLLQRDMIRQIEHCLTEAKASTLHCQVLMLPRHMITKVGQDVARSSADEPCGLRGASIEVYVEHKGLLASVGSILPDHSVNSTFELSVIFKVDKGDGWPPLRHIFDSTKVLKLRPEYRLVKRKLYSSASPVVHDFH